MIKKVLEDLSWPFSCQFNDMKLNVTGGEPGFSDTCRADPGPSAGGLSAEATSPLELDLRQPHKFTDNSCVVGEQG